MPELINAKMSMTSPVNTKEENMKINVYLCSKYQCDEAKKFNRKKL